MKIAIVTGASSGLGREFVSQIVKKEKEIEEIWIIARREDKLQALKQEMEEKETNTVRKIKKEIRVFPLDLLKEESFEKIQQLLVEEKPEIQILVNAAGFGKIGSSESVGMLASKRMIQLNCEAAVTLTLLTIPYMHAGSRILEICSTAAFQPFQFLNVYAASKAFLFRFTRALWVELLPKKIHVTAVCPYWIKDTEFIAGASDTEGSKKEIRQFPLASKVHTVASYSLWASKVGFSVATPGIVCTLHRIFAKMIPEKWMMGLWALGRRI